MRGTTIVVMMCLFVAGCSSEAVATSPGAKNQGRFSGIGVFDVGRLWSQMSGTTAPKDASAARLADDEHIIVVLDSRSGEVRQCGDHSGYCVTMNPWERPTSALPAKLDKHASELDDEANADMISNESEATGKDHRQ